MLWRILFLGLLCFAPLANSATLTLHPSGSASGDGASYSGGTAATAMDTNDGNTSYGSSSSSSNDFYVNMDTTSQTGVINSLQVSTIAANGSGWGSTGFTIGVKTNGSSYFSGSKSAGTSYSSFSGTLYNTNPNTGVAWTWSEINSLVAILNHTDSSNLRATELYMVVDYTPDSTPPAAVTLSTGTVAEHSIQLTWTAPGDDGSTGTATTYDVRYSTSPITDTTSWDAATQATGEPTPQAAGSSETFTVSGLTHNTTYYFAIKTADEIPNWSALSNSLSATTLADTTAPAAVTLSTGTVSDSSVQLTWTAPGDDNSTGTATTYDVRYSTSAITSGNWASATQATGEPVPQAAGNSESFTVTGLSPSTTYYFAIETADEIPNWSTISNSPSTTTAAADVTPPADVSDLTVTAATTSSISVAWTAPGDDGSGGTATTYDIRYSTSPITSGNWASATQATGEPAPSAAGASETFTVTGLSISTTYYIAIETADEVPNSSGLSNVAVGTTSTSATTLTLHPSGSATGDGSSCSGGTTATAMDSNDGNSSYCSSSSSGNDFYVNLDDTTQGGTITSVQISAVAANGSGWGSTGFTVGLQTNGSDYFGGSQSVSSSSYSTFAGSSYATNPNTGVDWTWSDINNLVAAVNHTDSSQLRITELYATITYVPDNAPPNPVTLSAGTIGEHSVQLNWTAPGDDYSTGTATTYDIRYSTSPITDTTSWNAATQATGEPTPQTAGSSETFTVSGLTQNTTYYFAIKTADAVPNWSALSNSLSATTQADTTAPAAVTLSTGTVSDSSVQLTWTAPGDDNSSGTATTYDIRYSTSAITSGNWASATQATGEPAPQAAGNSESFTVTGLSPSTTYYFAIETADEVPNWSTLSNSPNATTPSGDGTPPADVIDLGVTGATTTSLTVGWTAPGDDGSGGTATTYDIRYSTSPINSGNWASATQATGEPAPSVAGSGESFTITGLSASTTYYVAMKTADEVPNTSGLSNIAVGTTGSSSTTLALHPSGAATGDGASYSGGTAATAMDSNDGNTSYGSSTSSSNDFYVNLDDTTVDGTITSVQISAVASMNAGWGSTGFKVGLQTHSTSYWGSAQSSSSSSYSTFNGSSYTTNPNTGAAWTWTEINALIAAVDHTDSTSFRVTELYATVTYVPGDLTAPAAATLSTGTLTDTSVQLNWTAPGDDNSTGTATTYDIRYSTSAINSGNWASATQVSGEPTPAAAGNAETYTVTGLSPNTTYYFAIETADEVPNWSTLSNSPSATTLERPVGGYTADDVIPAAQVTQATDGTGLVTITWKGRDNQTQNVTLNTFEYSIDGGSSWNAPTNGDASGSLSSNWNDNGGGGWTTAATFGAATAHSFTFDTRHADISGIDGTDQSDIRVRFTLNDGGIDSASPATTDNFRVDDLAPTSTITSAVYDAVNDRMILTGTNFTTIAAASTDIKSYADWSKFVWDINGDNATTANISFVVGDVTSLTITDATTLTLQFTASKGTAIEATSGYGTSGGYDTLDVTAGFIKDDYGNATTTDGAADATLTTTQVTGTVYYNDETTPLGTGVTVRMLVNGASIGTATADGSGNYTVWGNYGTGDAVLLYIDNDASDKGVTVTVAGSSTLTGVNVYADHVNLRHDNGGSLTNADMDTAKGAYSDTDILYSVSGGALTVNGSSTELRVRAGNTFAPGGDVMTPAMANHGTFTGGSGHLAIDGYLNNDGNYTATSSTTTMSGNFTNTGSFAAGGGSVILNGTNQVINGNTTFNNFTKSVSSADTLTFAASSTTTINGLATINGAAGQLLSLRSSGTPTKWNINFAGTKSISYVDVKDSDASGSAAGNKPVQPTSSTDSGNNVDWFPYPIITVTKLSAVISDPVSGTTNPKRIPGAVIEYTISPANSGTASPDANSTYITDAIDNATMAFDVTGGVTFTDGATTSDLTLGTVSYSNTAAPGPYVYSYTPVPDGQGYDSNVTAVKITTTGSFAYGGSPTASFSVKFRVKLQ